MATPSSQILSLMKNVAELRAAGLRMLRSKNEKLQQDTGKFLSRLRVDSLAAHERKAGQTGGAGDRQPVVCAGVSAGVYSGGGGADTGGVGAVLGGGKWD